MPVKNWHDERFRAANAPQIADINDALLNFENELLDELADGKVQLINLPARILDEVGGWIAAAKDIKLVDDEAKALGIEKIWKMYSLNRQDAIIYPAKFDKYERIVNAVRRLIDSAFELYLAIAEARKKAA
jgi:hypothetical protein